MTYRELRIDAAKANAGLYPQYEWHKQLAPAELGEAECEYAEGAEQAVREVTALVQARNVEVLMSGAVLGKIVAKYTINEVSSNQRRMASTTTPALATLLAFLTCL